MRVRRIPQPLHALRTVRSETRSPSPASSASHASTTAETAADGCIPVAVNAFTADTTR
jgi:hypothetical protein